MRMARCDGTQWHYSPMYGLIGLAAAGVVLVLLRHDLAQGLTLAVAITSAAGWTRRPRHHGYARRSSGGGDATLG